MSSTPKSEMSNPLTADKTIIVRKTLKQFEKELAQEHFIRVSRSAMINIHKVVKVTPNSNGECNAQLSTGVVVKVGRKYRFALDEIMLNAL